MAYFNVATRVARRISIMYITLPKGTARGFLELLPMAVCQDAVWRRRGVGCLHELSRTNLVPLA